MKLIKNFVSQIFLFLKRRYKLLLIIIFILVGVGFWRYKTYQKNNIKLNFYQVSKKNLIKKLEVSGVIDAKDKARLRFVSGGRVTYVGAKEGEWVKKWQTIASIDQSTLKKQLEQDLNNYMQERWDWEDNMDQYDYHVETLETRKAIDKDQWDLDNEVLDVEIRDIAIKNSSVSAPFDGVLTHSPANTAGVQLIYTDYFEIVNPETLVFKAQVDEADISLVQIGQSAEIILDAYEDEAIPAQVNYIAYTSSQSSSGTVFIVEFKINSNNLNKFRIGMNGDVKIKIDQKNNVLAVPLDATRERDDAWFVDIKTGDKSYEDREIKTGLETDDYIEITEGLSENDQILLPE